MARFNIGYHGFVFFFGGAVDLVVQIFAHHRAVGGDNHRFQAVNALKLKCFGVGSAGHARQFLIQAEVVLEGDGGQGLVFALDFHAFFGFYCLVQAFGPAAAGHQTAGEFVYNHDFAFLNHIVLIQMEQAVRAQGGH